MDRDAIERAYRELTDPLYEYKREINPEAIEAASENGELWALPRFNAIVRGYQLELDLQYDDRDRFTE